MNEQSCIREGKCVLGIEFGSTRIKAVLVDMQGQVVAVGGHTWSDRLENGIWSYSLEAVHDGLRACYADLKQEVRKKYGITLTQLQGMGVSAMMHGYLAFDRDMNLLTPFRTWRNTITGQAASELTELFSFNIPQRWSIAHLHQAVLNQEVHVPQIAGITTLAGYVHRLLTGENVLGVGDAAGVFPVDSSVMDYHADMLARYDQLVADRHFPWHLRELLPGILRAGDSAGSLTQEGALFLDPEGDLCPGVTFCPPEGDAGTGMVATNSVLKKTGNVSAGTSVFAMIVLEKTLERLHTEIDMVTTPDGLPVAMVHCNTCTSDLNAWVGLFHDFACAIGNQISMDELYSTLFNAALQGDGDTGRLTAFNYYSGEPVTGTDCGVPLFARAPDAKMSLSNFMRTHIYASLATLSLGMKILTEQENVSIDCIYAHGGLFRTPVVGQSILAAALRTPVTVMKTATEGGAWGMALLALYQVAGKGKTLPQWLQEDIFASVPSETLEPRNEDVTGFQAYLRRYSGLLNAEKDAAQALL